MAAARHVDLTRDRCPQVCAMLQAHEKYYFGFAFTGRKGDEEWIKMDKKITKHDFPKGADHIELYFKIRFYPMDVTQVLQYVTLYQTFLAAHQSMLKEEIKVSSRDSMLLAALCLQATKGDYNPEIHTDDQIDPAAVIPLSTRTAYKMPAVSLPWKPIQPCRVLCRCAKFVYRARARTGGARSWDERGCRKLIVAVWLLMGCRGAGRGAAHLLGEGGHPCLELTKGHPPPPRGPQVHADGPEAPLVRDALC